MRESVVAEGRRESTDAFAGVLVRGSALTLPAGGGRGLRWPAFWIPGNLRCPGCDSPCHGSSEGGRPHGGAADRRRSY